MSQKRTASAILTAVVATAVVTGLALPVAAHSHGDGHVHGGHRCMHGSEVMQKATFGYHKLPAKAEGRGMAGAAAANEGPAGPRYTVVELGRRKAAGGDAAESELLTMAVIDTDAERGQAPEPFVSFEHHRAQAERRAAMRRSFLASEAGPQPIRITFRTPNLSDGQSYCTRVGASSPNMLGSTVMCASEADVFTAEQRDLLTSTVLPRVGSILSSYLNVNRTASGIILVPNAACGAQFTVPTSDQTDGVPFTDFAVYVGAAPNPDGVIAWASMCALNNQGRPAIARANFSPRFLDTNSVDDVVKAAVHELIHALGFAPSYMASSAFATPNVMVGGGTRRGGQPVVLYKGPAALRAAREHFACPYMDGIELENDGTANSASGHWERRYHRDDLMAGIASEVMAFSEMSFSVLVDSGHYALSRSVSLASLPDNSNIGLVREGATGFQRPRYMHNEGCAIFDSKCNTAAGGANKYFCFERDSAKRTCTDNFMSVGTCTTGTYPQDIPEWGQYFGDTRTGGLEPFNDYCPVVDQLPSFKCSDAKNNASNDASQGLVFSSDSRCFATSANFAQSGVVAKSSLSEARCLRARCPNGGRSIEFQIGDSPWRACPADGSPATVPAPDGYTGTVSCPKASDFCTYDLIMEGTASAAATTAPTATSAETSTAIQTTLDANVESTTTADSTTTTMLQSTTVSSISLAPTSTSETTTAAMTTTTTTTVASISTTTSRSTSTSTASPTTIPATIATASTAAVSSTAQISTTIVTTTSPTSSSPSSTTAAATVAPTTSSAVSTAAPTTAKQGTAPTPGFPVTVPTSSRTTRTTTTQTTTTPTTEPTTPATSSLPATSYPTSLPTDAERNAGHRLSCVGSAAFSLLAASALLLFA